MLQLLKGRTARDAEVVAVSAGQVVHPSVHVDVLALGPRLLHRLFVSFRLRRLYISTTHRRVADVLDALLHVRDHKVLDRRVLAETGTNLDQRAEKFEQGVGGLCVRWKGVGGDAAAARRVARHND